MPSNLRTYRIGDLTLSSSLRLPELCEAPGAPADWTFVAHPARRAPKPQHAWFHRWRLPDGRLWLSLARGAHGYLLRFHRLADFELSVASRRIDGHPAPATSARTVRHLLLDQIMPLVLSEPPRLALHASAVRTPRGVVAFVGRAGVGKSTLAAALGRSGWAVLSDDCLIVDTSGGSVRAIPSYPGVRLWSDSVRALYGARRPRLHRVAEYSSKQRLDAGEAGFPFCTTPAPLIRLYVLGLPRRSPASTAAIDRMSARDALVALLRFTYHLDVEDRSAIAARFDRAAHVANAVPVRRLRVPFDLSGLGRVQDAIAADVTR
jgi:hypothetical protein